MCRPTPNKNKTTAWTPGCDPRESFEIESGEIVLNKKKVWNGLLMTAFINLHSNFFLKRLFQGDKQTFSFGFNVTNTPYSLVRKHMYSIGLRAYQNGQSVFCGNTMAQRHPTTGDMLFLHRNAAKFMGASDYLALDPIPRAWSHYAKQNPRSSWQNLYREEVPRAAMLPSENIQLECTQPIGKDAVIRKLDDNV